MTTLRKYNFGENELIYHYCNAEAFNEICTNKTIRLCDINSMNDSLEMHWGISIWEKIKSRKSLLKKVGKPFLDQLDISIQIAPFRGSLIAACFSMEKDLLSQWRGYADDGKGFVIGFCANDLNQLPVKPLKIEYELSKQLRKIRREVEDFFKVDNENSYGKGENFDTMANDLFFSFTMFKNPTFSEEKEIRLVHRLNIEFGDHYFKLSDNNRHIYGENDTGKDVKFIMKQNGPASYIDYDFTNNGKINPVKEVIIGPKNKSLDTVISLYLETLGIGGVTVTKSAASYR